MLICLLNSSLTCWVVGIFSHLLHIFEYFSHRRLARPLGYYFQIFSFSTSILFWISPIFFRSSFLSCVLVWWIWLFMWLIWIMCGINSLILPSILYSILLDVLNGKLQNFLKLFFSDCSIFFPYLLLTPLRMKPIR